MEKLDGIDLFLLAVAAYVSIMALVRLMRMRHRNVMDQVQQQFEQEAKRMRKESRRSQKNVAKDERAA